MAHGKGEVHMKCDNCGKENLVALKDGYNVEIGFFLCMECHGKYKKGNEEINKKLNEFLKGKPELKLKYKGNMPNQHSNTIKKSKVVAGVLALLLGTFGSHKFYLGKFFWGCIYLLLSWTFIPTIVSIIESIIYFTMSEKKFTDKYSVNIQSNSKKTNIENLPKETLLLQQKKGQDIKHEQINWKGAYKEVAKNYKVFKLVGYKGGIPGLKPGFMHTNSLHICATSQGVMFFNPAGYKAESIVQWDCLVHIATSTEMKPTWQAITTGMAAQMKTAGDAVVTGLVAGITEKHPLIFFSKQNINDEFAQEIKFDDTRNEKIKMHIMEMRAKLFPKGISQNIAASQNKISDLDITEKIKKLTELKQQGIITQEEFDVKKKSLLDKF